jgi:hypothetical protein
LPIGIKLCLKLSELHREQFLLRCSAALKVWRYI